MPDETSALLLLAIISTTSFLRMPNCIIRVDGETGFQSLLLNKHLKRTGIKIEIADIKNKNKIPFIDKADARVPN